MLGIASISFDVIILGASFLNGYFSIYDMENDRLGLVPQIDSDTSAPVVGSLATDAEIFSEEF